MNAQIGCDKINLYARIGMILKNGGPDKGPAVLIFCCSSGRFHGKTIDLFKYGYYNLRHKIFLLCQMNGAHYRKEGEMGVCFSGSALIYRRIS